MHSRVALARVAIICSLVLNALPAWSTGGRDATFGTLGEVRLSANVAILTAAQQPDGKVLLAGYTNVPGTPVDLVVMRLLENGSLDPGFGVGGTTQTDIAGESDRATAMILQSDGRIVLAGCSSPHLQDLSCVGSLVRLNSDGTLDSSFGVDGRAIDPTARGLEIKAIAVQADDGIVAVGQLAGDIVVTRLHAYGALDTSFGVQGIKVLDWAKLDDKAFDVAIQGDGRILVAGEVGEDSCGPWHIKMAVLRLLVDGTLDPAFGTGGWWAYAPDCDGAMGLALRLQADGRILLAADVLGGSPLVDYSDRDRIYRLSPTGVLDTTYGTSGALGLPSYFLADNYPTPTGPALRGLSWLADAYDSANYYVDLVKLAADGTLDQAIGESGVARIDTNDPAYRGTSVPCILPLASGQVLIVFDTMAAGQLRDVVVRVRADDPPAGTIRFESWDVQFLPTELTKELVIHRTGGSQGAVSVHYETIDGDAVGGEDYDPVAGQVVWPDGDTSDRHIVVSIPGASQSAGYRSFSVRLTLTKGEAALENVTTRLDIPGTSSGSPPPPPPPPPPAAASGGGGALDPAVIVLLALMLVTGSLVPQLKRRRRNKTED